MSSNKYLYSPSIPKRRVMISSFASGLNATSDESILPINVAKSIYNFDFSSGALTEGYGLSECDITRDDVDNIWVYTRYDFDELAYEKITMYSDKSGNIYYIRDGQEYELGMQFTSRPYAVNYRLYGEDVILITSETDSMAVWNGITDVYTVLDSPLISSMVIHYERMFCTVGGEKNSVWFSDDLDPTNWDLDLDAGGYIQMLDERGRLNKVLSYLNYVYIFRDYGISRMTAFSDQTEFSVSNLFVSSGQIYPSTVTLCGDYVMFLTRDGLYSFDGLDTDKILSGISPLVKSSPNACATYYNGKYYVAFNFDFASSDYEGSQYLGDSCYDDETDTDNNAVLVYDMQTGEYDIMRGAFVSSFASTDDCLYAILNDGRVGAMEKCGAIFDQNSVKSWASGMLDFGTELVKTVREIYIEADDDFMLSVISEKGSKEFLVSPTDGLTKVRVNVSGRKIGLLLRSTTKKARITRPSLVITTS